MLPCPAGLTCVTVRLLIQGNIASGLGSRPLCRRLVSSLDSCCEVHFQSTTEYEIYACHWDDFGINGGSPSSSRFIAPGSLRSTFLLQETSASNPLNKSEHGPEKVVRCDKGSPAGCIRDMGVCCVTFYSSHFHYGFPDTETRYCRQTEAQVLGFPDNRHKSFPTKEEAEKFVGENRNTKAEPLGDAETRDASTQPSTAGGSSPSPPPSSPCSYSSSICSRPTPVVFGADTVPVKNKLADHKLSTPGGGKKGYWQRQGNKGQANKSRLDIRVNVSRV